MKTPDEIKKGLEVCNIWMVDEPNRCMECPYFCTKDCADTLMKHALSLIQQLEAQVPRWIPVEERLPEQDTLVIVGGYGEVATGFYHEKHGLWITHAEIDFTHWMPLPEPPNGKPPIGGYSDDFVHGNHG